MRRGFFSGVSVEEAVQVACQKSKDTALMNSSLFSIHMIENTDVHIEHILNIHCSVQNSGFFCISFQIKTINTRRLVG